MELLFTKVVRGHKLGKAYMLYAMEHVEPTTNTRPSGDPELTWIGDDDRGIEWHIVAIPDATDRHGRKVLLVIHCMPTALERKGHGN